MPTYSCDVVYMDDDPMMVDLVQQFISWKYQQWKVCSFTDPQVLSNQIEAGEIAARVWIIDLMMPVKNGPEIAREIREKFGPRSAILGYTALEPVTLQSDPQYRDGLMYFTQLVRKNEGIARLLGLADDLLRKNESPFARRNI